MTLGKKWVVLSSIVVLAAAAFAVWPFLPKRYQSETTTTIAVVPQLVPTAFVGPLQMPAPDRLQSLKGKVLSRTNLKKMITEFGLYKGERRLMPMEDTVERMRRDIGFRIDLPGALPASGVLSFTVSFVSPDGSTSQRVVDRLSLQVLDESMQDRVVLAEAARAFLQTQVDTVRGRLIEHGKKMDLSRAGRNVPETLVLMLEDEALRATYKSLLAKLADAELAASLEQRGVGTQFWVIEQTRVPDRLLGPTRTTVTFMGAAAGLCLGLALVAVSAARRTRQARSAKP